MLLNIGITDNLPTQEIIRIKLTNYIVVLGIILSSLNTVLNIFMREWPDVIAGFIVVSSLGLIYFLIYKGSHTIARASLFISATTIFTVLKVLYGPQLKMEPLYIVFLLSSIITFNSKRMKFFSLVFVTAAYSFGTFANPNWAIFANKVSVFANINYFMFSALLIFWIVSTLLKNHFIQSEQLRTQAEGLRKIIHSTAHNLKTPVNNVINISQMIGIKIDVQNQRKDVKEYFNLLDQSAKDIDIRIKNLQSEILEEGFEVAE